MAWDPLGAQVAAEIQESLQVCVSVEQYRGVTGGPQETTAPHGTQQNQHIHTFKQEREQDVCFISIALCSVSHSGTVETEKCSIKKYYIYTPNCKTIYMCLYDSNRFIASLNMHACYKHQILLMWTDAGIKIPATLCMTPHCNCFRVYNYTAFVTTALRLITT